MPGEALTLLSRGGITRKLSKLVRELEALLRQKDKDARGIHQLRRHTKKLRAWLLLLQAESGSRKFERIHRQLKILARAYSGQRDARVLLDTLERLTQQGDTPNLVTDTAASADPCPTHPFPACSQALHSGLQEAMAAPLPDVDSTRLEKALKGLKATLAEEHTEKTLRSGLRHSYRKARRLYLKAQDDRSHEHLHRLRRWVKYLAAQMELIVLCRKGSTQKLFRQLTDLGNTLGKFHDLDVFLQQTQYLENQHPQDSEFLHELPLLRQLARTEEAALIEECLALAEGCFGEKVKRFAQAPCR